MNYCGLKRRSFGWHLPFKPLRKVIGRYNLNNYLASMKPIIYLRPSLLIVSVLLLCLRANAFTMTRQGRESSAMLIQQRFIKGSATQSVSRTGAFNGRHFSSHSNEDVSRDNTIPTKLSPVATQLLKTMMLASIISIGSIFAADVASVSATSTDHLNGTLDSILSNDCRWWWSKVTNTFVFVFFVMLLSHGKNEQMVQAHHYY